MTQLGDAPPALSQWQAPPADTQFAGGGGVDLSGLDSAHLDCIDCNLAALARHDGVRYVRGPFSCQWHFGFDEEGDPLALPRLERVPTQLMVSELTGRALTSVVRDPDLDACGEAIEDNQPLFVVGDAYLMEWLPSHRREHMDHSFLVDGVSRTQRVIRVADAYQNRTEWGEARPTRAWVPADTLAPLLASASEPWSGRLFVLRRVGAERPLDDRRMLRENVSGVRHELQERLALTRFCSHYAERAQDATALARFSLACWLTVRARSRHALWLADVRRTRPGLLDAGFAERFEQVVAAWQRVSEFAYIALRRVAGGRRAPTAAFEMIEREVEPLELRLVDTLTRWLEAAEGR